MTTTGQNRLRPMGHQSQQRRTSPSMNNSKGIKKR
jgi:hypothetical protein